MKTKTTNTAKNSHPEWVMGGNPSAIEAQESEGQKEFIESCQLPLKCNYPREIQNVVPQYHKMGIKTLTGSKGDDLFIGVQLPDGWNKAYTDHAMWNTLLDDKGRERATIFYKAAFYDREAFINFKHRLNFRVDREGFLNGDYSQLDGGEYTSRKTPYVGRVTDYDGTILYETEKIFCDEEFNRPNREGGYTDKYNQESSRIQKDLTAQCKEFLEKNFPLYEDINAYWNDSHDALKTLALFKQAVS